MKIEFESTVVATPEQVSAELDGETIILYPKSGEYFGLDSVGARVWELLQESATVASIVTKIEREFDVEPNRCRAEITAFIQELESEGLIEVLALP